MWKNEAHFDILKSKIQQSQDLFGQSQGDLESTVASSHYLGSPEQFSTLFALIMRRHGIATRVMTGFRIAASTSIKRKSEVTLTAADTWTWVEIALKNDESTLSWTTIDPTGLKLKPPPLPSSGTLPSVDCSKQPAGCDGPTSTYNVVENPPFNDTHSSFSVSAIALGILGFLLLLEIPVVLTMFRRRTRRKARLKGSPRIQIVGAWLEVLDQFAEFGVGDFSTLTIGQILDQGAQLISINGEASISTICQLSRESLYNSEFSPSQSDSDRAWRVVSSLRRDLKSQASKYERFRALFRYRRLF
jgi:hypothetical protein